MYDIYTEVCHETGSYFETMSKSKTRNFIRRKLESKEDWWLISQDAVKYGFVDGVVGEEKYKSIASVRRNLV